MNHLFTPYFTLTNFVATALTLLAIYLILRLLDQVLKKAVLPEQFLSPLRMGLNWALLFFEPVSALILLVIFIFIRPNLNGPVAALILFGGFSHLRNYLSGFIMKVYDSIKIGNRLRTTSVEGVITFVGRLGLRLRTSDGENFSNYSKLLSDGYTLVTGEESGGFYQLNISLKKEENKEGKISNYYRIYDLFAQAPFLNPNHKPDISKATNTDNHFFAKILVDEEHHLHELIALLDENGWKTEIK